MAGPGCAVGVAPAGAGAGSGGGMWQPVQMPWLRPAWSAGKGRTPCGPWQSRQSSRPATGCGIGAACLAMSCVGLLTSRMPGASSPANCHWEPWQAPLEQKLLLSLPPAFDVSWQAEHVWLNALRCRAIQLLS